MFPLLPGLGLLYQWNFVAQLLTQLHRIWKGSHAGTAGKKNIMATLLPPPKRVKLYHGIPEPAAEPPKPSLNILVQFVSDDDGHPLAPAVNLPASVSREGLEALVNKLNTQVRCEKYPETW